jgi:hypothetical protein
MMYFLLPVLGTTTLVALENSRACLQPPEFLRRPGADGQSVARPGKWRLTVACDEHERPELTTVIQV